MDMGYDENIFENKFFRDFVNQHSYVFKRVVREGWILCVPRSGSFLKSVLSESDVAEHILIPSPDSPTTRFQTLSGKEATLIDRTLTILHSISKPCSSYLLFEETFYNDSDNNNDKGENSSSSSSSNSSGSDSNSTNNNGNNSDDTVNSNNDNENNSGRSNDNVMSNQQEPHKYRVWCLERPLLELEIAEIRRHDITVVTNLREAMGLLWTEVPDKNAFKDLEIALKEFERVNKNFEVKPLHVQRELVGAVYTTCLHRLTKNTRYEDKSSNNEHYCHAIKISVETYVLYSLRSILRTSIANHTAIEDADLNRTIKSLDELEFSELGIRTDLQDGISRGKLELSRLDHYATVLGKAGCIKRAIRYVSPQEASPLLSSDDLLSILVSLVLRTGLSNWTAQLIFLKLFRFSTDTIHKADEIEFLITTLEASIEHIKSGALLRDTSRVEVQETVSLEYVLKQIKGRTSSKVETLFSTSKWHYFDVTSTAETLCHPLCTCESCEQKNLPEKESLLWPIASDTTRDDKDHRTTILHVAARYGHTDIVEYLLNNGDIDVNVSDVDGLTPLHYASGRGHQKIMLLLLHANADSRKVDTRYNTPLHFAADYGHENCVKTLLYFAEQAKLSFDISPANANGDTPLHYASKWGYVDIVQILLERGADREAVNKRGQTPLTVAHSKHIHRLFSLVRTYDKAYCLKPAVETTTIHTRSNPTSSSEFKTCLSLSKDEYANRLKLVNNSPKYTVSRQHLIDRLSIAIAEGDVQLACYYIGFDTYVRNTEATEARTRDFCHPLCICEQCAAITENFSEKRKKISVWTINACNTVGETALHVASASNCVEIVRLLLDAGANVNVTTKTEQRTPLHLACLGGSVNATRLLLNCATCDVDAKDLNGDTPLHLAIRLGNTQIIKLLVRHDVNIKLRNSLGVTPLQEMERKVSKEALPSTLSSLFALLKSSVTRN